MMFTVFRSTWDRGNGDGLLLGPKGMCCLGFLARACGVDDKTLENIGLPEELATDLDRDPFPKGIVRLRRDGEDSSELRYKDTYEVNTIVTINDRKDMTDGEREGELTRLFSGIGIAVEFAP